MFHTVQRDHPAKWYSTSNFKWSQILSLSSKVSKENYAGRDVPTPDEKAENDTESTIEHKYIIIEQINTGADEQADNAVVDEDSELRFCRL